MNDEKRFWANVKKTRGCWLWTGYGSGNGYGGIYFDGRPQKAHVVSYVLANGSLADGLRVLHKCDVRNCVNPKHLFAGTQRDNVIDMYAKGRVQRLRGEQHKLARLTALQVREMRKRYADGETRTSLAEAFGVSYSNVWLIVSGRTWRDEWR